MGNRLTWKNERGDMANTVFILGAGASYKAKVPLMANFLDVAENLWKTGKVQAFDEQFSNVFRGRSALQQVHSKAKLDIQNIESVFAAFEMGKTLNKFGNFTDTEINDLIASMKTVIFATIETNLEFHAIDRNIRPPEPYNEFIELVDKLRNQSVPKQDVALITFNYDLALDFAMNYRGISPYYGLEGNKRNDQIPLFKLHGSLNWAHCSECGSIVPWYLSDYYSTHRPNLSRSSQTYHLRIGSRIGEHKHGDHEVLKEPLIAPPTWSKSEYHKVLSPVWSCAAKELSDAENIFVIGYSLPESDSFFRYLYALGTVGSTLLKRFWVFDPDEKGDVEKRFRALLGHGAEQIFHPYQLTFADAIREIGKTFGVGNTGENLIW